MFSRNAVVSHRNMERSMRRSLAGKGDGNRTINRDYRRALKEIEGPMGAARNTAAGDRLDVLVTLVEAWEAKDFPLDRPGPGPVPATID